jgi:TolB-like protein/DNA-binding winged helix-turn-helix (wHTH) protein/Flp pilus assembly protein TadD
MKVTTPRIALFAPYALDLRSAELRKFGTKVKMGEQAFQILCLLLEHPGEMVTREELRAKLWANDTFVDFDHGLNSAVQRLRDCLSDSAANPRWIETLPRRGYRFIGQVEWSDEAVSPEVAPQPRSGREQTNSEDTADLSSLHGHSTEQRKQGAIGNPTWATLAARRHRPTAVFLISTAVLALLLLLFARWRGLSRLTAQPSHQTMLAVLPFEDLSGNPNQDYFSDGLTEELITQLGSLSPEQLGVIARTTSMAYKRTSKSAQQIAGELGADYILESSVRRDGDQMRITVQLIRSRDQSHVWAHSYDRQISRSIALQEEVAKAVAEQIRIKLNPAHGSSSHSLPLDPQANEAYLRGRYFGNQFTVDGYRKAIVHFQQAIDHDPNFAEAYSGLADSYYFLVVTDSMSPQDGESKALDAARKAVTLDEGLAESHNALGNVMLGLWNWSQAEAEFKRAIELNPSYSSEHRLYAATLVTLSRHGDALEQINQAMRLDPLSLPNNAEVVRTLYYARDYDRAIEQATKAMQLDPEYYRTHFWLARVYAQKKMYREAIAESEKVLRAMPDSNVGWTELAYCLAAAGRLPEARTILQHLEDKAQREFVPAYNLAVIHIALNEKDVALNDLQKAYQERDWAMMVLAVEPRLDPLRSDPRFQELLRQVVPSDRK